MEPDDNLLLYLALLLLLILVNAFFSMSEIAIVTMSDSKVRRLAGDGSKSAQTLVRMIDQPSRFLATIQVGVTLSGLLAAAVASHAFTARLALAMRSAPVSPSLLRGLSMVLVTLLLGLLMLVLGHLVPKRIAMQHSEAIAMAVAGPLAFLSALELPFVALLSWITNGILRLIGIGPETGPEQVTEEEIRLMVDAGEESGGIEEDEKDMINNIFEFDDRTAVEMMTHRTEMVALERNAPLEEIIDAAVSSGYSRIPVYDDDLDTIVGILYVKDLLGLVTHKTVPFSLQNFLREPMYVLESTSCKVLLEEFQQKKLQMAIVVDEYGGTSGLVTMEDLLESIVGNIQDEYDDEEEDIVPLGENLYEVDGLASLDQVVKLFSLELAEDEAEEFETIGGYIVHKLGYIPPEEEHPVVELSDTRFTVACMDERRIDKLRVQVLRPAREPAGETAATPKGL